MKIVLDVFIESFLHSSTAKKFVFSFVFLSFVPRQSSDMVAP